MVSPSEVATFCKEFLRSLIRRGLRGVKLVIHPPGRTHGELATLQDRRHSTGSIFSAQRWTVASSTSTPRSAIISSRLGHASFQYLVTSSLLDCFTGWSGMQGGGLGHRPFP
jgi:hypothetical protein